VELGDVSHPNPSFKNMIVTTDEYKELSDIPLMTMQVTILAQIFLTLHLLFLSAIFQVHLNLLLLN